MNAALVTYDRALTVSGKTPSSADAARLEAAAQALRLQAALLGDSCRLKFFAVDGALKADCARLLALRLPLSVLLGKVPLTWRLQVPP